MRIRNKTPDRHPEYTTVGSDRVLTWIVLFSVLFGISCNFNAAKPGKQVLITEGLSGNRVDGYWLYLPKNYDEAKKYPVILFLTGGLGVSSQKIDAKHDGPAKFAIQEFPDPDIAAMVQDSFIIINPHLDIGPPETKGWHHHAETLFNIVEEVSATYSGDMNRVILTGLSHGAGGSWEIAKTHSNKIAALIPIAGRIKCENDCDNIGVTPFWIIHNKDDERVSVRYAEEVFDHLTNNKTLNLDQKETIDSVPKSEFVYSIINESGHDAWNPAYSNPNIYKWLLEQTRN